MIKWINKEDGETWEAAQDVSDLIPYGKPGGAILLAKKPDWIKYPPEVQKAMGVSEKGRVVSLDMMPIACPKCGDEGVRQVIRTAEDVFIMSCKACKSYSWCQQE